jgi:hypothetical protein
VLLLSTQAPGEDADLNLYFIGCEVFTREATAAAAASANKITLKFLTFQLHQQGGTDMRAVIQDAVDQAPDDCDAILLGYGLCNNGLAGVQARKKQLVVFRSHDCIACLLGSQEKYRREHEHTPGTYWLSAGWIERANDFSQNMALMPEKPAPNDPRWLQLLEKYGEDNAAFLWDEMRKQTHNYSRLAYIDTAVGPQATLEAEARDRAAAMNLTFERMEGDGGWIRTLIDGPWDQRFVVVPPGKQIVARYDDSIMDVEPV